MKSSSVYYKRIKKIAKFIAEGNVLSIDPSCGSASSLPGWAHYQAGVLVNSGVIKVDITQDLYHRLKVIADEVKTLSFNCNASVLVYEDIPTGKFGRFGMNKTSVASLQRALGATMGASMADHSIGIRPNVWKKLARPSYKKGDERDAIEMGYIICKVAREILDDKPKKKTKAKA